MTSVGQSGGTGDTMVCRSCGRDERASEGYPCADCGTFICVMCDMRGIVRCRECEAKRLNARPAPVANKSNQ